MIVVDASALVDYFAAADRLSNPAFGVQYPYFNIKERDESFLLHKNSDYVNRLRTTDKGKWYDERIKELLAGKTPKKVIVVPKKLVNVVLG